MEGQVIINVVILCGGRSARMGTAKHRLLFTNNKPIYKQLLMQAIEAYPETQGLYLSLHDLESALQVDETFVMGRPINLIFDEKSIPSQKDGIDIGPAAGLLAALHADPHCTWLVLACDYPLISVPELRNLFSSYNGRLTCFENAEGWAEPLLGLWSPEALACLSLNVRDGCTGPKVVVKELNGKRIRALDERSLLNANTPREWSQALALAKDMGLASQTEPACSS